MARLARLVLPGIPYHVTQRGNRRQQTFFEEGDYALYRDLLAYREKIVQRENRVSPQVNLRQFTDTPTRYGTPNSAPTGAAW